MTSIPSPPVRHPTIGTSPPAHLLTPDEERPRYIRSPVYVLRLVVGAFVLVLGFLVTVLFENALIGLFIDTSSMVESWPDFVQEIPLVLLAGLAATIVAGVNLWLITTQHWRRLGVLDAAAAAAALLSVVMTELVLDVATSEVLRSVLDTAGTERRLSLFLPSLIAMVTVGIPWIRRSLRSWVIAGTGLYGLALVFFAVTPPVVILLDVGVGVFVGALLGLAFKTPNLAPSRAQLAEAMTNAGIDIVSLDRASVDARGSVPWFADTRDGDRVFVKVLSSEHRAADLLYRIYRWLRYRHAGDRRPFTSLRRAAEHEALAALQAGNRHISTPRFLAVADVGGDGIMLAYEAVNGRSIDAVDPEELTDGVLGEIWDRISHLHEHGIAHRDLRLANLLLADDGTPYVIDFGFTELSADDGHKARDVAELLASTAGAIGIERAVEAAVRMVQRDELIAAIPWIQPQATSAATRSELGPPSAFTELRKAVQAATEIDEVRDIKVERVSLRTMLVLVSLGLAAYILIPVVADSGNLLEALSTADGRWVAIALAASAATYAGAALGIIGSVPCPLPTGSTVLAQLASSFSNRVTPAKLGGLATNVRYLQIQGVPTAGAVSAVGLNTLAGVAIHVPATLALGLIAGRGSQTIPLPASTTVALVVGGLLLASGLALAHPVGRRLTTDTLVPAIRSAVGSIGEVAKRPLKLAQLFTGSFIVTSMYVVAMAASLQAFGAETDLVTVAFVYLAGSAVASAAPTPGGVGATEAALAAGYSAVGITPDIAVSAVLLFRSLTFWLPILPGWIAFSWMQRTNRL